eukprot:m.308582 g.308582  ORF g.308582 m.308582 type:complete len:1010 (+) comp44295_c0_seq1:152-3181(+)
MSRFGVIIVLLLLPAAFAAPGAPYRLRVEYMNNPLGIDEPVPRFSWALDHSDRSQSQTVYRIVVYEPDKVHPLQPSATAAWDSGKVTSNRSTNVEYGGQSGSLKPTTRYHWTVQYWDKDGAASPASDMAYFHTGISDWEESVWLDGESGNQLRFEFELDESEVVAAAHAYIFGLGYYQLRINGDRVGDLVLGPFTTFEKRLLYDTHDVTNMLEVGPNAVAVTLGHGWYAQPSVHVGGRSLRLMMIVQFENGSSMSVGSSDAWMQKAGPVVQDDIYVGETYDSRQATPGWDMPGYHNDGWTKATVLKTAPTGTSSAHNMQPVKKVNTYSALNITEPAPGTFVFDFGQNMAGFCTLHLDQSGSAGSNLTILHAEMMSEDGFVQHRYGNSPELTVYIFDGSFNSVDFEPYFTYYGFRFVQITGFPGTPDHNSLKAHFVHSAVDEESSIVFSEDYDILNSVQHITRFASLSNYISVPTDCPQRERRGWLGDAQLSAETTIHNFDMAASYTKYIRDIYDTQQFVFNQTGGKGEVPDCVPWYHHGGLPADPAWDVAYTVLTYWMHKYYDDVRIVKTYYEGVKQHLENLRSRVDPKSGLLTYSRYGDWCSVAKGGTGCQYRSPLVSSFYFIQQLDLVAYMANMVGQQQDASTYREQAMKLRKSFNDMFYNASSKMYVDGDVSPQTTHSLALVLGVVPPADVKGVVDNLVAYTHSIQDHLNTGIVGTKFLLSALTDNGQFDLALTVASQVTVPSWGWMVVQQATTLWESWLGSQYKGVSSRNHIMFGGQGPWYYQAIAGINMADGSIGWEKIRIQPQITNDSKMASVSASLGTYRGEIYSAWSQAGHLCGMGAENSDVKLQCAGDGTINHVTFASFGTPNGTCGHFQAFNCSSKNSVSVVEKACVGKSSCTIRASNDNFGGDPCFDVVKHLYVEVTCGGGPVFSHTVVIPVGSMAELHVSTFGEDPSKVTIMESGKPVWQNGKYQPGQPGLTGGVTAESGGIVFQAGSGRYVFDLVM